MPIHFKYYRLKELDSLFPLIYEESCFFSYTLHGGIEGIKAMFFELSNMCNYSIIHRRCPAHDVKQKSVLPSDIYYKVVDELGEVGFSGVLSYHRYNEPLIDPRLSQFITYAKEMVPKAKRRILTNGYYLCQEIVDHLVKEGLDWLEVTAYSREEFDRVSKLQVPVPFCVYEGNLDFRKNMYDIEPKGFCKPCAPFYNDVTVNAQGNVVLCCLDWKNQHVFGDLSRQTLREVLKQKEVCRVADELASGHRILHLCRRCTWQR